MFSEVLSRYQQAAQGLMRIFFGFLYFTHGAPKLFGWFGGFGGEPGQTAELLSRYGIAGVLEVFGGILILVGLFTRPVAFILSGQMAVAYFWIHLQRGFWPWANGGELAVLFCFAFLFFATSGAGAFGVDNALVKPKDA